MAPDIEILTKHTCLCGEGPLWDSATSTFYWIDIVDGTVNRFSLKNKNLVSFNTGQKIGSIAMASSGKIIAALKAGIYSIDFENKQMDSIVNPEAGNPGNRFNDGKCDPAGRFWVGSMSDNGIANAGTLYTLEKDASVSRKLDRISISNGMAWDVERGIYYYIDTPTRKVMAFDYDDNSGNINNGRPVVEIVPDDGTPDGMTIDMEGMLWIAHWNGGRVSRWNPHNSQKLFELFLPVSKVTSCAFGGRNLEELYITTASVGLDQTELEQQPLAGATFVYKDTGTRGLPATPVDDSGFYKK